MRRHFRRLADQLTGMRLVMVVPLWVLALLGLRTILGIGLAIASATDVLDGPIARRQGRTSRFGSQLDSVADHTLTASTMAWLVMFRPDLFREHGTAIAAWAVLAAITVVVGLARFRRFANLHLYSAKLAGFTGYLFAIWLLILDRPSTTFFRVAIVLAFVATAETLIALALRSRVDEHVGTIIPGFGAGASGSRSASPPD